MLFLTSTILILTSILLVLSCHCLNIPSFLIYHSLEMFYIAFFLYLFDLLLDGSLFEIHSKIVSFLGSILLSPPDKVDSSFEISNLFYF